LSKISQLDHVSMFFHMTRYLIDFFLTRQGLFWNINRVSD